MGAVTQQLIQFVEESTFASLPPHIVHATKRILVDTIACALAGIGADRGKIAVKLARRLGGPPESSIIGTGDKLSCVNAAFANSELVNALDFDATPHSPPIVIPPILAVAEMTRLSGQELILAITLGHEAGWRLYSAMSTYMSSYVERATSPDVFGNSNEAVLGAALGVGRVLGLDPTKLANTLGLAGYFCSLPVGKDWHDVKPPKPMIKYAPTGWLSKAAVMAGLLAAEGCEGNRSVLDGRYGFWKFYGAGRWDPDTVVRDLGSRWVSANFQFKPYACCRFFHAQLDCFTDIIETHDLQADDIESVEALGMPFAANSDPMSVTTQSDAQFSLPFNLAAAAHRIGAGADWQDGSVLRDPKIRAFMKKVSIGIDPKAQAAKREDPKTWTARVTVVARGKTHVRETMYARGTPVPGFEMSDDDLSGKLLNSASGSLSNEHAQRVIDFLWKLEQVDHVSDLFDLIKR